MPTTTLENTKQYAEIVASYDALLFDCDGVIWSGDDLIEGAKEVLSYLRSLNKKLFFITNNATKSRAENKAKFDKLGIECHVDEIFSSAYATAAYMKEILNFPEEKKVYVIGEKGIEDELDSVGIKHCGGTSEEDNVFIDLMDFSTIVSDPDVGAVLCGLDMHINYKKIARGFRYLRENEGCLFIATNLDSTFPTHGSVFPGAGAIAAALMCCSDQKPLVIGKPEKPMLDCLLKTNHLDKSRTLMIGDRLDTDILFGVNGGIDTMMVLTGVHAKADYEKEGAIAVPTFVVDSLGSFKILAKA